MATSPQAGLGPARGDDRGAINGFGAEAAAVHDLAFGQKLAFFVRVAESLPQVQFVFANGAGSIAANVGGGDVVQFGQTGAMSQIKGVSGALQIGPPRFLILFGGFKFDYGGVVNQAASISG